MILRLAVAVPLRRLFDYRWDSNAPPPAAGSRVEVRFSGRTRLAWVVEHSREARVEAHKLMPVERVLDRQPLWSPQLWRLLQWCWTYYCHAPGEVISTAMPALLKLDTGEQTEYTPPGYQLSAAGISVDHAALAKRARRQWELLQLLQQRPARMQDLAALAPGWRSALKALVQKGWVEPARDRDFRVFRQPGPELNPEQRAAVAAINDSLEAFSPLLLDGVTGSGKTEVYLELIEAVLDQGRQALVLVPEIGLTPQLMQRFRQRLGIQPTISHSGMAAGERRRAWQRGAAGEAAVIIGTRSAVFFPMKHPGAIILDEEHDLSYKQMDHFRYSARDVAVRRAQLHNIPVVLGSATPSLESLHNAQRGRYRHLKIRQRASGAAMPVWSCIDLRKQPVEQGLAHASLKQIETCIQDGGQALVFLNRRGYAPLLMCHQCGWQGDCPRCDAHFTYHRQQRQLRCHRCGLQQRAPLRCPDCDSLDLQPLGEGTERLEALLRQRFPQIPVVRVDRDTTQKKQAMKGFVEQVLEDKPCLLVGTQMLAKGHHFPNLRLALVINVDQSLYSADFRALERLAQLLTQVAGRSGRGDQPGRMLLQTYHPDHPMLIQLMTSGYADLAETLLQERKQAGLPPAGYQAVLRAEARDREILTRFLQDAAALTGRNGGSGVQVLGPIAELQAKRAGLERMQLLLESGHRSRLHRFLHDWLAKLENQPLAGRVRWALDVDPQEF